MTWIVRHDPTDQGPIRHAKPDPWPRCEQLAQDARHLLRNEIGHLTFLPATTVVRILSHGGDRQFRVLLAGRHAGELEIDQIVANVGYHPDHQIYSELQLAPDPATDAPTRWPADLPSVPKPGDAAIPPPDPQLLITAEPDFYILGASVGRDSRFTIAAGLMQIRQLFTILGDRPDLNLYA